MGDYKMGAKLYEITLKPSRPLEIVAHAGEFAKLSRDGKQIVYNRRGYPFREKYEGSLNGDVWMYDIKSKSYKQLSDTQVSERYPVFSSTGDYIYCAKSDLNNLQIERIDINSMKSQTIKKLKKWSARDLSIAREKDVIVFEYFDKIAVFDVATNKVKYLKVKVSQEIVPEKLVRKEYNNRFTEYSISPDGKLIAFAGLFDLMAIPEKGGKTKKLTHSQKGIADIKILQDNNSIIYTSYEKGAPVLYRTSIKQPDNHERIDLRGDEYIEYLEFQNDNSTVIHFTEGENYDQIAILDSTGTTITYPIGKEIVHSSYVISPDAVSYTHLRAHET